MKRATKPFVAVATVASFYQAVAPASAVELSYPQIIRMHYEATDPKIGGQFVIWLDREKVWHGLDSRLYPPARYVDVTYITPAPGSPPVATIEVMNVNATTPDYYHIAGIVRFRISGMTLKSSNAPTP